MDHPLVTVDREQIDANDQLALDSPAQDMDIDMDNEMPELRDEDPTIAREVEMQAVHNNETAPLTSSSLPPSRTSNRRPRLVDDEDEDRDRRHPSQRVAQPVSRPSSSTSSGIHAPQNPASISVPQVQMQPPPTIPQHVFHAMFNMGGRIDHPFRFFQHLRPNNPGTPENNDNLGVDISNNNATPVVPPQPIPPQPQQNGNANFRPPTFFGGLSLSFNLGQPSVAPLQTQPPAPAPVQVRPGETNLDHDQEEVPANPDQPPHPNEILADLFDRLRESVGHPGFNIVGGIPININFGAFGLGLDGEREDPERARKLVNGLDKVPVGLVRRLVRVGGTGGGMGHDETQGGDAGCAICWDTLLDSEGAGFEKPDSSSAQASPSTESSSSSKDDSESKQPKIISLPCAHVFHADCLIPWFSRPRQTTCPTCRFNVDPQNLTYVPWSARQQEREEAESAPRPAPGTAAQLSNPENGNNLSDTVDQGIHNHFMNLPMARAAAAQALAESTESNPAATTAATSPGETQIRPPAFPPAAGGRRQVTTTYRTPNGIISFTQLLSVSDLDVNVSGRIPNAVNVGQAQAPDQGHVVDEQQFGELPNGADTPAQSAPRQPQPHPPTNQPPQQHDDFLANLDPATARAVAATDRAIVDVFSRLFGGSPEQAPQTAREPPAGGQERQSEALPQQQSPMPNAQPTNPPLPTQPPPQFRVFANLSNLFSGLQERDDGPKPPWTLPPPPGPTLRQRIERREREAGVRCCDVSCGVGPSDEDPELSDSIAGMEQLPIMEKGGVGSEICLHRFHGSCLVSATRVALKGADTAVEGGNVEVSCPVCRGVGCVSKEQWDEGVAALQ